VMLISSASNDIIRGLPAENLAFLNDNYNCISVTISVVGKLNIFQVSLTL